MLYNNQPTIIANWKMNPTNYSNAINLFKLYFENLHTNNINNTKNTKNTKNTNNIKIINNINNFHYKFNSKFNLIVAPPNIYLFPFMQYLKSCDFHLNQNSISLSAQNFCWEPKGAFTGDSSVEMLKDLGIKFAILGHSECRKHYQESDEVIAKKVMLALNSNIIPIICVGETQEQFSQGEKAVKIFLKQQLLVIIKKIEYCLNNPVNNINNIGNINFNKHVFIAYEPIWAIGSGAFIDLDYIQKNISYIQDIIDSYFIKLNKVNTDLNLKYYILYGGSVNHHNAKDILQLKDLAGVLVGGASLKFEEFKQICNAF